MTAKPTTARADTPSGLDSRCSRFRRRRARSRRRRRSCKTREGHPARGLLDQSRRRRRQGRLPGHAQRDRHPARRELPGVLEDRDADARRRRAAGADPGRPLPGRTETGRTVPGAARRVGLRDQREAARHRRNRSRRPGRSRSSSKTCRSRRCRNSTSTSSAPNAGCSRRPSHCGTYKVESEFVPWNTALAVRHTTNLITIDSGPGRHALPERRPAALARARSRRRQHRPPGAHSPFTPGPQARATANRI